MDQRPKVLLLVPHLGGGGAEQVTALLARGLCPDKYELHLGLITQSPQITVPLPPWVSGHALGVKRVRAAIVPLLQLVRSLEPDVILSSMAHLNFLVLSLRPFFPNRARILVRQNGTASAALAFGSLPSYTPLLYRLLYPWANRVICQSDAMADDLALNFEIPRKRLTVLANPVDLGAIRATMNHAPTLADVSVPASTGPHLLAIGRLAREKGFDLLLHALVSVRKRFPHADLALAGAGPEEEPLRSQCRELSLQGAVRFLGWVDHPVDHFPSASVFVLPSRHEAMPNALLEAAAAGLPLVALPASEGLVNLLQGQPGVWLATEVSSSALANSLLAALATLQPGERFAHPFIEAFGLEPAVRAYESLIDSVADRSVNEQGVR